jgi:hypothetical protein
LSRVLFLFDTKFLASVQYENIPDVNLFVSNEIVWLLDVNSEFIGSATCSPNKLYTVILSLESSGNENEKFVAGLNGFK